MLLAVIVGWLLVVGHGVILPVVGGLLVAYVVLGLAELVGRLPVVGPRAPRLLRHAVSVLVIGAALFGLLSLVVTNIGQVVAVAPAYEAQLLAAIQRVAVAVGVEIEPTWEALWRDLLDQLDIQRAIGTTVASLSAIVTTLAIVLIYAGFMLAEKRSFAAKLARLSDDPGRVLRFRAVIDDINRRIGTYLVVKTGINALLAGLSYAIMRVAGIEFAGFWALLIGLFNYVPYVGSFLGVLFPMALSVLQFGAVGPVAAIAATLTAAQVFVEPYLMGSSLKLSPLVILVSLVVWGAIRGIPGAILSVPTTAILVIVLSNFPGTRPIAILLSLDGDVSGTRPRCPR